MEENSHQKLLRRQLTESLDLNESLAARIEQLKAYIWRAGLEVPRPEDGVHGPIVEREQSVPHVPAKRLRTGAAGPELSDSVPLSFFEASLDRSVRLAFARSRDASRIDLPEDVSSDPLRLANESSTHAEHSRSAKENSEQPSSQEPLGEASKAPSTGITHEDSEVAEPLLSKRSVERSAEHSELVEDTHKPETSADEASATHKRSHDSFEQRIDEAAEKSDIALIEEADNSRNGSELLVPSSSNRLSAASFRHELASPPREQLSQPIVPSPHAQTGYSERGYWLESSDFNSERETGKLKLNSDTGRSPVQSSESPQPQSESPEIRANHSGIKSVRQQLSREDPESPGNHRDKPDESSGEPKGGDSNMDVVVEEKDILEDQVPNNSSGLGVLPQDSGFADNRPTTVISRPADATSKGSSIETDHSVVAEEEQYEISREAPEESHGISEVNENHAQELQSTHEQLDVSSEEESPAHDDSHAPKRPHSPADNQSLDSLRAKVRAEVRANESAPLLSRPPNTESLIAPLSDHHQLAPRTGMRLSEPPLRKPRDDWATQFRESFNPRKARGALERAGITATPSLTDSMRRIAESEKGVIDESKRRSLESGLSSDDSDDDLPQSGSVPPPTVALMRPDSSSGDKSQLSRTTRTESFTSTITPVRAAGRRSSRNTSPNISSSPLNDSQRGSDSKPEQQLASDESLKRPATPKDALPSMPPLPRSLSGSFSQPNASYPLPAVPQSILKRLAKKIPSSVAEKAGSSPRSDQLASPFRGSVRPPMTSTPATKVKEKSLSARTPSSATKAKETQDTSPNSSIYQSALQSLEMSPRRSREQSDSPSVHMKGDTNKLRPREKLQVDSPQFVPQPVQPIANSSMEPNSPLKNTQRARTSYVSSAAAEERGSAKKSTILPWQMPDITSSAAAGNRRVSFKLPSSSESNPASITDSKPKPRRRLVRNVYPVDLSNTSQSSFPDMSMQAAADAGDISEHRERPPLNPNGGN